MKFSHIGILCFILLVGCQNIQEKTSINTNQEVPSNPDTVTLVFAGDIMCHYPQVKSARTNDGYDFRPWFKYVKPIISEADLAFANLETTLSKNGPYSGYPRFKTPETLGNALADAGFDVIVTANNHSNDTGKKGVLHTLSVLNSLGLHHTGTFSDSIHLKTRYPLIFNAAGMKIGLLNYTYDTNGIPDQKPTIVNLIDSVQIKKDITRALSFKPDLLLAFMHWGYEYRPKPNSKQKRLATMMLRLGVNHIIGAHPHVVQPISVVKGEEDKHLVAYSLGNFVSNQNKYLTDGGAMLKMKLILKDHGPELLDWEYIPVWRHIGKEGNQRSYEIIPTYQFLDSLTYFGDRSVYNEMVRYHNYLESHLSR